LQKLAEVSELAISGMAKEKIIRLAESGLTNKLTDQRLAD
jgi:hypothetical protein